MVSEESSNEAENKEKGDPEPDEDSEDNKSFEIVQEGTNQIHQEHQLSEKVLPKLEDTFEVL